MNNEEKEIKVKKITYKISKPYYEQNLKTTIIKIGIDENNYKLLIGYRVLDPSLTNKQDKDIKKKSTDALLIQEKKDGENIWTETKILNRLLGRMNSLTQEFNPDTYLKKIINQLHDYELTEIKPEELENTFYNIYNTKKIHREILKQSNIKKYTKELNKKITKELGLQKDGIDLIFEEISKNKDVSYKSLRRYMTQNYKFKTDDILYELHYLTSKGYRKISKEQFKILVEEELDKIRNIYEYRYQIGCNAGAIKNTYDNVSNKSITRNYDLIFFNNGILNTNTQEFTPEFNEDLGKLTLETLDYHQDDYEKFEETELYKVLEGLLKTNRKGFEENNLIFYRSVGSCFTALNNNELATFLHGKSGTGKGTILDLLRRVFGTENITYTSLYLINKNDGFDLESLPGKSLVLEDDISKGKITKNGGFNTLISGGGLIVKRKYLNPISMVDTLTPRYWGACNTLPQLDYEGAERRLCLILCDNHNESYKDFKRMIKRGFYDKDFSLFVSYCINQYFNYPEIINEESKKAMMDLWKARSDKFIELILEKHLIHLNDLKTELENKGYKFKEIKNHLIIQTDKGFWFIETYSKWNNIKNIIDREAREMFLDGEILNEQRKNIKPKKCKSIIENMFGTENEKSYFYVLADERPSFSIADYTVEDDVFEKKRTNIFNDLVLFSNYEFLQKLLEE